MGTNRICVGTIDAGAGVELDAHDDGVGEHQQPASTRLSARSAGPVSGERARRDEEARAEAGVGPARATARSAVCTALARTR